MPRIKTPVRRPRKPRIGDLPPELLERIAALSASQQNVLAAINPVFKLAAEKAELRDLWGANMRAKVEEHKEGIGLEKEKLTFEKGVKEEELALKKRGRKTDEALARARIKTGQARAEAQEEELGIRKRTFKGGKKRARVADLLSYGLNLPLSVYGAHKRYERGKEVAGSLKNIRDLFARRFEETPKKKKPSEEAAKTYWDYSGFYPFR